MTWYEITLLVYCLVALGWIALAYHFGSDRPDPPGPPPRAPKTPNHPNQPSYPKTPQAPKVRR